MRPTGRGFGALADQLSPLVMAAAVADFRPKAVAQEKLRTADGVPDVVLEPTTDILAELGRRNPRSLEACTLLDRTSRRIIPTPVRYRGFEIGDEFVLGYGLDFSQRYRNLDRVVLGDVAVLQEDPDAYVPSLYRR